MSSTTVKSDLWERTLSELELSMTKATYRQLLDGSQLLRFDGQTAVIGVRNEQAAIWLDNRLRDTVERTLAGMTDGSPAAQFEVIEKPARQDRTLLTPPPDTDYNQKMRAQVIEDARRHAGKEDGNTFTASFKQCSSPTDPFLQVSHYAIRFWRPVLKSTAADLWLVLSSYEYEIVHGHIERWPTVAALARKVGITDRNALLGHPVMKKYPHGRPGAIDVLQGHGLLKHFIEDAGERHAVHHFYDIVPLRSCPVLTFEQVTALDSRTRKEHKRWLELFPRVDYDAWCAGQPFLAD